MQAWADWWEKTKQAFADWFNEIKTRIANGQFLEAACQVLFEGVFFIVEKAVIWGATAAAALVTAGAGAIAVQVTARAI